MDIDFQIQSTRLSLRLLRRHDAAVLAQLVSASPSLHPWFDWASEHFSPQDAKDFIRANHLQWIKGLSYGFGIYQNQNQQLIGMVAINELSRIHNSASLGYWVADAFQGQGNGKEALIMLCQLCFNRLQLTRIEIICDPNNAISRKFIESCGARYEGRARNRYLYAGIACDGDVFSLLPGDL